MFVNLINLAELIKKKDTGHPLIRALVAGGTVMC